MIYWIIAAFCAFFVKGLCGFANTLVFTSILSFGNNNISISPVDLALGLPPNIIMAYREREHVKWSVCLPTAALLILGSIPGLFFLKNTDAGVLKIFFGFVIIALGIEMLIRERNNKKVKENKILLVVIGISAGILCGLFGIGALLSAYVSRVTEDTHQFKANMCVIFLIENIFRAVLYTARGVITVESLKLSLILLPVMLIALFLGMLSVKFLDEKKAKTIIIVMLMISGLALIINSINRV